MSLTEKSAFFQSHFKAFETSHGEVFIREMTGKERDAYNKHILDEQAKAERTPLESIYAACLVRSLSDSGGNRIFADGDTSLLSEKMTAKFMAELYDIASEHNAINSDTKKNSDTKN